MNKRMMLPAAVFMLGGMACSEPSSPELFREWADDTRWAGMATMQSGLALEMGFRLSIHRAGYPEIASIYLISQLNRARLDGLGHISKDGFIWIILKPGEQMLDGVMRPCLGVELIYVVSGTLSETGEFQGTIDYGCGASGPFYDRGIFVIRRL